MNLALQPKQTRAYLSRGTEMLYGGAAGGGKSHLVRVAAISWCIDIPGLQVYLFRRKYPELWKNHMEGPSSFPELLADAVNAGACRIVDKEIRFANGSMIYLCHCQHAKDVLSYQGAEIHVLLIDELTQWERYMYTYLRGRLRMVGIDLPDRYRAGCIGPDGRVNEWDLFPRAISGANPGGVGHNWVKAAFVDLGLKLHRMPKREGGMVRVYIPARLEDNPKLVEADPDYEDRLEGLGNAALVRAMRLGDWDIVAGGALDDVWDRERHVVPPFRIPSSWRIDRSFDWGSSKPFSVGWWAESDGTTIPNPPPGVKAHYPRGTLFRIAEWYGWNGQPNEGVKLEDVEIGAGIRDREKVMAKYHGISQRILPGPADSSIFDADPGKDSIAQGINRGYSGSKDRQTFTAADKSPGSRKNGLAVMRRMLKAALADPLEEPGLYIFDTCTAGFIRTVPVLPRDERNPDDVDSDAEDHAYDDARYRITAARHSAGMKKAGA